MSSDAQPTANSLPATRSCQRCNQKKIRCNKTNPCDGCSKSNSECIFPAPGRVPRRRKRPLKAELVTRLQGLQQEIRELVNERTIPVSQDFSSLATSLHEPPAAGNSQDVGDQWGKLVIAGDSTQYVTHEALAGLENQVRHLPLGCSTILSDSAIFFSPSKRSGNLRSFLKLLGMIPATLMKPSMIKMRTRYKAALSFVSVILPCLSRSKAFILAWRIAKSSGKHSSKMWPQW